MWKQLFNLVVTLIIFLGTFGAPSAAEEKLLVGFAQDDMSNDWRAAQVREAEAVFAKHDNIEFVFTDAGGDVAQNILDIENLADQGIDLLMVSPRNPKAMTPVISALYDQGIAVVLLTRSVSNDKFTTFISPDDAAIASQAADLVATATNGNGKVLILQGVPTATTAIKRTRGFVKRLDEYPGLEIADILPANYKRSDAIKAVQAALDSGLEFDAIYAQSDSMAVGARLALKQAGILPNSIPIVGIDYIPAARDAIRSGDQYASFTYPTCGDVGAEMAVRILSGESVARETVVESQLVTKETVEAVDTIF